MIKTSTPDRIITQWMEITRLLRQSMMHGCKPGIGMNPMQMHALMIIQEHEGLTMTELAKFLRVTSPSATSFVNRMVRMKWVKRLADGKNRKLVRLKLSEAGIKTIAEKMKEHTKVMHDLFSLLSSADQKTFARILTTLRSTLALHTHKK